LVAESKNRVDLPAFGVRNTDVTERSFFRKAEAGHQAQDG